MREEVLYRIENRASNRKFLDIDTVLEHFALINYALPKERLMPYIPQDRFEIPEFSINGKKLALMSAVPFVDSDFHFRRIFPFLLFRFPQTNYRVYVFDKWTKQHCVWFFGTTLGSYSVYFPKILFKIPWHYARYQCEFDYDFNEGCYKKYEIRSESDWGSSIVKIRDTGKKFTDNTGFADYDEMKLVLTHPVTGFYYRKDKKLGTYSIWHEEMYITRGEPVELYFSLYERLGLLSREEMQNPLHICISPKEFFEIYLPPVVAL